MWLGDRTHKLTGPSGSFSRIRRVPGQTDRAAGAVAACGAKRHLCRDFIGITEFVVIVDHLLVDR